MLSTKHPVVVVIDDDLSVLDAMSRPLSAHEFDTELYDSPGKLLVGVMHGGQQACTGRVQTISDERRFTLAFAKVS